MNRNLPNLKTVMVPTSWVTERLKWVGEWKGAFMTWCVKDMHERYCQHRTLLLSLLS